jgi:hypothetical protein
MADNTIINCDVQGNIFTGVTNCGVFDTGDYFGTFISKKGTKVPNDTTFLTKFKEEVQKNNIIPFKGYDYRNAHEENQMATSSIGNMQLQRLGKPMLEFDVVGSVCEMKQLSKVNNISSNWANITLTADTSRNLSFYLNGTFRETIVLTNSFMRITRIMGGYQSGGNGYNLQGSMSSTKFYNTTLSAAEILQNYNALKSRFGL